MVTAAKSRRRNPSATAAAGDSRVRLLAAAEKLIVEQGLPAVRTRELVKTARVNISLIAYYFGGVGTLVTTLLGRSVDRFVYRQRELAGRLSPRTYTLEEVLYALIEPIVTPAEYTPGARAALVIQEILSHADPELTASIEGQLQGSFNPLVHLLARKCPHLDPDTVWWRLCCVYGGGISMGPRAAAWHIYRNMGGHRDIGDEDDVRELVATAAGALSYAQVTK